MSTKKVETVSWINRWDDPRREDYFNGRHPRLARKVLDMYGVERPIDLPSQTQIPVDEIDGIKDENLKEALAAQKEDHETDAVFIHIPVAYMPGRIFSHGWHVRRRTFRESFVESENVESQEDSSQNE